MKLTLISLLVIVVGTIQAEDTPGFFIKAVKNVPRVKNVKK